MKTRHNKARWARLMQRKKSERSKLNLQKQMAGNREEKASHRERRYQKRIPSKSTAQL